MSKKNVTLMAELPHGKFYWVTQVSADSEDEAITAAENLFAAELEKSADWSFSEFEVTDA